MTRSTNPLIIIIIIIIIIYCYQRVAWSSGPLVCHVTSETCKNGSSDRHAVWIENSRGPNKPCIRWEFELLPWEEAILRGEGGGLLQSIRTLCGELCNKSSAVAEMGNSLATIDMGRKWGACPPFLEGELCPRLTQCRLVYLPTKWHLDPSGHLATADMGRKLGMCPFWVSWSPSNTMWQRPRPTSMPSFILIDPTIWPQKQYTNVTDRQDRQWSNSMGQTILQTVAQKPHIYEG